MDERQLLGRVREEIGRGGRREQAAKRGQEGDGGGGEVHDVVGEDARFGDGFEGGLLGLCNVGAGVEGARQLEFGTGRRHFGDVAGGEQLAGGLADEGAAVHARGGDELRDAVAVDVVAQRGHGVRVEVVGAHKHLALAGRNGEGPHARAHVAHGLARRERLNHPRVLRAQPRVPVHFAKVEAEVAVGLVHLDVQVRFARQDLVGERAELGLGAHVERLVDDGRDVGVLVN